MILDHDIFFKQAESRALAVKVDEFLKANNLAEPIQLPIGQTRNSIGTWNGGLQKDAQKTMRQVMSESINTDSAKKATSNFGRSNSNLISTNTRIDFNRSERDKALKANVKEFKGICKNESHGHTLFRFRSGVSEYYCVLCKKERAAEWNLKKKKEKLG